MRRLLLAAPLVLLAGCGSSATRTITKVSTPTQATSSTPTVTTSSPRVAITSTTRAAPIYFEGAVNGGQQRPSSLELTADGTLSVEHVQWTAWGGPNATGSGTAVYHGCNPNCAAAATHMAVVSVRLSDVRSCRGRRYYAGITLTRSSGRLLDEGFLERTWSPC